MKDRFIAVSPGRLGAIAIAVLAFFGTATGQKPYEKNEMLDIVRKNAADKSMSAGDFANVIQRNGVNFELTARDEAAFRRAGAGTEVIELIRNNFRPPKSLVVRSNPAQCQVLVDGQARGTTSAAGVLVVRNVVGSRKVTLRKQNYRDEQRTVIVLPSGSVESFYLSPLPGKLTITANVDGGQITIQNVGTYTDKITDLELPVASYEVNVSKPGYWPESKTIQLSPGFLYSWQAILRRMTTEEMLEQVKKLAEQRNCSAALEVRSLISPGDPALAKSDRFIGYCFVAAGSSDRALEYLRNAVNAGEPVTLAVMEKHGGAWAGKTLSLVYLIFHRDGLEYKSVDYPDESFRAPYANIRELSIKPPNSRLYLKIRAKLPKKQKESVEDFELYSTDAVAIGAAPTTCDGCPSRMRFILQMLQQFRTGN